MGELELADIFPGLDDEALSSLDIDNPWTSDIFENFSVQDIDDALLTDITSKPVTKPESTDVDIFGLGNDLIVGDEVEVNNLGDHFTPSSINPPKGEFFPDPDEFNHTDSTDASPETLQLTPEIESSCSTPSNPESCNASPPLTSNGKKQHFKRCTFEDIILEEVSVAKKRACNFSPPIVPCELSPNAVNRVHYVLQKGQTLILQTEKPNHRLPQAIHQQSRIKALNVHPTSNQSIYRTDNDEYIRIKPLATHQRPTGAYTMTPPGSQTGSDTDLRAESPMDANESRGRFSVLNSRNGTSVTSTSAIRLAPAAGGIYATTSRYNNSSYISRQTDDSSYSGDFNGEYSSGYATGSSTPAYRQQPMFQNSPGILVLTDEEKRTLLAEGYSIPTRLPLSKQDERNLKKIRRKIKNKISAQESRRKKKEYVETLEKKVENYAQENARLKGQVENLEMHNRTILSQLRQLRHLVDKTASNGVASSISQTVSTSSPSTKTSPSTNPKKTSNSSIVSTASNSSAYLMVFLACFAALFAGQPDNSSSSSASNSYLTASSSSKGHIVGDLSTFGSLHQIGYTWSGRTQKMGPRIDGDNARGPNVSYMREVPSGTASIYRMHEWARTAAYLKGGTASRSSERTTVGKPVSRSRLLGSAKEYEECEPMTWWEHIFGQSGGECHDDKEITQKVEKEFFFETSLPTNETVSNGTAVHAPFALPRVEQNPLFGIANQIIVSA